MLPNRTPTHSFKLCGGGNYKTPVLNGNSIKNRSRNVTTSRNMDFKGATDGDRYVPQHNQEQFDYAKVAFKDENILNTSSSLPNSPEKDRIKSNLIRGKSANDVQQMDNGIEMFIFRRNNAPIVPGTQKQNILYKCMNPSSSVRKAKRVYPKVPVQSIDAPGMAADYYYNIIDWSSKNLVAVALEDKVYTFNVQTSVSTLFKDFESNAIKVTSLKFSKDGAFLAVGLDNGYIHLFKTETQQFLRKFGTGNWRICSATWASCGLLSFGNRGGLIQTHDVRERLSFKSEIQHHEAEVCGLSWVCNDQYLVSGSADSIVNVYTKDDVVTADPQRLYSIDGHVSTVKAIAECPFMYGNIIATSGGLNDGSVKFWNLSTGEMVTSVQTDNRVCFF
uniref:Anaphase-promoting complex subunit 4-like WD40 domain-containing protein n=1 Tax=Panagrolaimus davidi TaxID=227884 RepID=A0A914Q9K4_9BILA